MACSGSLTPCFVNNDYEIADIIYSTVHAHHKVLTWSWVTVCSTPVWAPLRKWWHYCCITAVFVASVTRGENIACLLLQLLCQPGERLCCVRFSYGCCCGCCVSQERINVCAVPTAPRVSFQPLGCALPTLGSGNSVDNVNSETFGVMNRISKTTSI